MASHSGAGILEFSVGGRRPGPVASGVDHSGQSLGQRKSLLFVYAKEGVLRISYSELWCPSPPSVWLMQSVSSLETVD